MIVLTIANLKGGAGKTTTAMMLAWWAANEVNGTGQRVVLLDLDTISPSASEWHDAAHITDFELQSATGLTVGDAVDRLRAEGNVAYVIIDTPARDTTAVMTSAGEADLVVITLRSGTGDVGQVAQTLPLLKGPLKGNPNLKLAGVMISTGTARRVDAATREAVESAFNIAVADAQIPHLRLYSTAKGAPIGPVHTHYEALWNELREAF